MKRIRQGQTRWALRPVHGHGGLVDQVYVLTCTVTRVSWSLVEYFDGQHHRSTSHWGWLQMGATRRRAWAKAWAMVRHTDAVRGEQFAAAWDNA